MFWKKKKESLGKKEETEFLFEFAEDAKKLQERHNPLVGIRAGTFHEVPDARKVAKDIMLPMGYSAEVAEDCRQILAFVFLYLIYQHAYDNACGKEALFPSLDDALSFLSGLIVMEKQDTDDGEKSELKPKSFRTLNYLVLNAGFFERHDELPLNRYPTDSAVLLYYPLQSYYPAYSDVFLCTKTNPWLFKTAMLFLSRSKKLLAERAYMATLALQEYIDTHEDCVRYKKDMQGIM